MEPHKQVPAGLFVPGTVPICVPARLGSTRAPGKLLAPYGHGTVLSAVLRCARASGLGPVTLLAEDEALLPVAKAEGVGGILVQGARNGTERIAKAVALGLVEPCPRGFVVNLQGDAVGAPSAALELAVSVLAADTGASVGTVGVWAERAAVAGRTTAAVAGGRARWFSRHPLPFDRDDVGAPVWVHVGVYAYRREALLAVAQAEPTPAERLEQLEQLRFLESGHHIAAGTLPGGAEHAFAVDTPADLRFGNRTP